MEARLIFSNVRFAQPDRYVVPVELGQTFRMTVEGAGAAGLKWGFDGKDPILSTTDAGTDAVDVTTEATGTSRIYLTDDNDHIVFRLVFDVYNPGEAANFDVPAPVIEVNEPNP